MLNAQFFVLSCLCCQQNWVSVFWAIKFLHLLVFYCFWFSLCYITFAIFSRVLVYKTKCLSFVSDVRHLSQRVHEKCSRRDRCRLQGVGPCMACRCTLSEPGMVFYDCELGVA